MSKHTPGPWKAGANGYGAWPFEGGFRGTIIAANGSEIYAGPASFNALKGDTPEQAEANARLIAAAPSLLDAAKALVDIYERKDLPVRQLTAKWQNLQDAIRLAEGDS